MKLITFYIYCITIGNAVYVGKTTQDPKVRLNQHLALLEDNDHHTDKLQGEYNRTKKLKHKILKKGRTFFKKKIAILEQRAIDRFSNCNEQKAIAKSRYSLEEFGMSVVDFIACNWLIILIFLFVIYTLGRVYGL